MADELKCVNVSKSDERSGWTNYRALANKIMDELTFAWLGQITCVGSNKLTSAHGRTINNGKIKRNNVWDDQTCLF